MDRLTEFFGPPIDVVTRADLIAQGELIEAPGDLAREFGLTVSSVALTAAAQGRCVTWSDDDSERTEMLLEESERLRAVVWMATRAIARADWNGGLHFDGGPVTVPFEVQVIDADGPSDGDGGITPATVALKAILGDDDDGDLCVTITLPHED